MTGHVSDHAFTERVLRDAPAALISIIAHLIGLILLALLVTRFTKEEEIVLVVQQSPETTASALQSVVVDLEMPDVPPLKDSLIPVELPPAAPVALGPPLDLASRRLSAETPSLADLSPDLAGRLLDAQKYGIEIVVVFDSTGSMRGEIDVVKDQIRLISRAVLNKIPAARFSLVSYRDRGDPFLFRKLDLGSEVDLLQRFMDETRASGGGDRPEAVQAGMYVAMENDFRTDAQKVMLVFGDAPPHDRDLPRCLRLADSFRRKGKSRVHTITCKQPYPMEAFYEIAKAGGGHAFVLSEVEQLMEDILVLAFGQDHRREVLEFFELDKLRSVPQHSNRPSNQRPRRRLRRS
ncbi:vWA domain-containing protein [Roseiconus nitratireducens]|nr:vWA domain-containing protein [Roseiconus nitratireducens]